VSLGAAAAVRRLDGRELGAIFAGGAIGTLARAELADLLSHPPGRWPWPTLIVNLLGAFLLGYFATRLQERLPPSTYRRPLLGTGLCGGLTTFSTMQLELLQMLDQARYGLAAGYALVSIAGGFLAVALASNLVRRARLAR
jgi:CrcB protein